jgi:hypothetical protein
MEHSLYLLVESKSNSNENSEYKTAPTAADLKKIPLANLKFFSSHNSFIQDAQFGGLLTYYAVKEMIKLAVSMPICIELDISNLSLKPKEVGKSTSKKPTKLPPQKHPIFLDHMTQRAHTFTSILDTDMTVLDAIIDDTIPVARRRSSWWGGSNAYGFEEVKHFACYNKSYHDKIQKFYSLEAVLTNIKILLDNLGEDMNTFPIVLTIDATQIKKSNSSAETPLINKAILVELHRVYDKVFHRGTKYHRDHSLLDLYTEKLDTLMNAVLLRHTDDDDTPSPHILKRKGASTEVKLDGITGTNTIPSYTDFLNNGKSDHTSDAFKKKQKKVLTRFYPSYFIWGKVSAAGLSTLKGKKDAFNLYKKLKSSSCMGVESSTTEISDSAFDSELDNADMSTESTVVNCHVLRKPGIDGGKTVECKSYLKLNYILAEMVFGQNNHNFVSPNYKNLLEYSPDILEYSPDILENIKTEFTRMYSPLASTTAPPLASTTDGSELGGFSTLTPTPRPTSTRSSSSNSGIITPDGFGDAYTEIIGIDDSDPAAGKRKSSKKKKRKTTRRKPQTTRRKPQTTRRKPQTTRRKRNSLKKKKEN